MGSEPTRRGAETSRVVVDAAVWWLAALTFAFFVATARGYGYFRDELYYLANGEHLGFGYVEHPPFIGLVAAFVRATLGDSLLALRALPALAGAVTVWLAGAMAAELGAGRFGQALAASATLAMPAYVGLFSLLSMNAFDILWWALALWLVIRILRTGHQRLWLAFGVVAGLGLQTKVSMLFLGAGLVVGLVVGGRWEAFRSRWFWLGGVVAGVISAPYALWQAWHGWPLLEFMENARQYKNVSLSAGEFIAAQIMQVSGPLAWPVWLAGLLFLLRASHAKPYRTLGWTYLGILGIMIAAGGAKPYYMAPAYTVLFAAGAVGIERVVARRSFVQGAILVAVLLAGIAVAPFAKALLPEDTFVAYAHALGMAPQAEEREELGRLPQHFADMHGWPELAETVARAFETLPLEDRARACIYAQNYGEAGAIDFFGEPLGLPKAISGHNSYFLWGPRDCTGDVVIVIGDTRASLEAQFQEVTQAAIFTCTDCMPYENNRPIWIARQLKAPLVDVWPRVKRYI